MPQSYENIPRFPNKSGRNVSLGEGRVCLLSLNHNFLAVDDVEALYGYSSFLT